MSTRLRGGQALMPSAPALTAARKFAAESLHSAVMTAPKTGKPELRAELLAPRLLCVIHGRMPTTDSMRPGFFGSRR